MRPSLHILSLRALAALLLFLAAQSAFAARTLLVFGDSLSAAYGLSPREGWVHQLAERAKALGWQVANASISGETTAGGLRRLPADLKRHKPAIVVIALGANDALRGQPIAAMRSNLEQMVRLARQSRAEPVLVGMMIPPNYGIEYAAQFHQAYAAVARKHGVTLVPFLLEGVGEKPELFLPDQLHPNAKAQAILLDNVWRVLEPVLRKARG